MQQQQAPTGWQHIGIDIGNPSASNTIIKLCNPYCSHCAQAHHILKELIRTKNNIYLKVICAATNNEYDPSSNVVKHLLAINQSGDKIYTLQALDDWYLSDKKDFQKFANKYPMNCELKQQEEKIEAMSNWCKEAEIISTPTIFVNGRKLPESYNIHDLKNIN